jgi:type VI secretion system protein ImpC
MAEAADFQDLLHRSLSVDDTWRGRAPARLADFLAELPDTLQPALAVLAAQLLALNTQLNFVLHHPEFQAMEASWRGLHFMVRNTDTDPMLKIRLIDISRHELARTLR